VLLDFGSARQAIGVATRTLTALVTPGYAPFEQYDTSTAGEKKQGPWTDIYSLGATLYRAVTGKGPPDAMGRVNAVMGGTDILKPASEAASGDYSPAFLSAIDWALEFLPENRPQSIDEWRGVLAGRETRPAPTVIPNVTTDFARAAPTEVRTQVESPPSSGAPRSGTASPSTGARVSAKQPPAAKPPSTSGGTAGMVATDRIAPPPPPRGGKDPQPKQRARRGAGRLVAEIAAVLLITGAMGAWYFLTQPAQRSASRIPPAAVENAAPAPSAELEAANKAAEQRAAAENQARIDAQQANEKAQAEAALEKAQATAAYERKRADVESLLREATADLAADRLTTPADKNAFSRYRAVLALDPANETALEGLHDILRRYLVLAKAASRDNNFELAGDYLSKATAVSPGAESIAAARAALGKRKTAFEQEQQRVESEARQAADEERQRMEAAMRATEEERKRLEAARLAADEERRRIKAEREAEIERKRVEQEEIVTAKLEADFKKSQEIAALLASADEALQADRLTAPPDDNALAHFEAVLAIDPQNVQADAGMQRIADRYAQLALEKIAAYQFDEAEALIDQANAIYASTPAIAPARQQLRDRRAAYDGRRPVAKPPFRITLPPVTGANTCSPDDPTPEIERFSASIIRKDGELDYVATATNIDNSWEDVGVNKEPRAERLYLLGRTEKLDGALMYWFRAVGTQCFKVHVDAYLVDLQTRTIYSEKGSKSDLEDLTRTLIDQFKNARQALAKSP
jgi:hypothetical protein